MSKQEQIILISGACGGIGKTLAHHWDQDHSKHLLLLDSDSMGLQALDDELRGDHTLIPFDLWAADQRQYDTLANMIETDYGRLDALVHLAAHCGNLRPLMHCDPERWLKGLQVNLTAPFWLTQACIGLLRQGHNPHLIFTLHQRHREQEAYWHSYGVAQAGLEAMIETLIHERSAYPEITISRVDPHWVDTNMSRAIFPNGEPHWRQPDEIVSLYDQALTNTPEQQEIISP
ncbi:SDR family NAD(P)-dependent oxidoreductase [Cardiobacteriaceae bacterium TAE3-ERU3]|nr:SDR family NAD(P)-dependent oxidoreductase [Cardiobacteriaceae bacterium TAE3-ERU3]